MTHQVGLLSAPPHVVSPREGQDSQEGVQRADHAGGECLTLRRLQRASECYTVAGRRSVGLRRASHRAMIVQEWTVYVGPLVELVDRPGAWTIRRKGLTVIIRRRICSLRVSQPDR